MARFNGKKVIITKVANGIHKADELVERASKGDAPIYNHSGDVVSNNEDNENESIGRKIYKHLMNGVSNMLPFVVAGGILIAVAFFNRYNAWSSRWSKLWFKHSSSSNIKEYWRFSI